MPADDRLFALRTAAAIVLGVDHRAVALIDRALATGDA
jgi:hypothetical protein